MIIKIKFHNRVTILHLDMERNKGYYKIRTLADVVLMQCKSAECFRRRLCACDVLFYPFFKLGHKLQTELQVVFNKPLK